MGASCLVLDQSIDTLEGLVYAGISVVEKGRYFFILGHGQNDCEGLEEIAPLPDNLEVPLNQDSRAKTNC